MYPYHNINIQRIKRGELVKVEKGKGDYAIVLVFSTYPFFRPIKHHAVFKYAKVLLSVGIDISTL